MIPNLLDNALLANRLDDTSARNGLIVPMSRVSGEELSLLLCLSIGEGVEVGDDGGGVTWCRRGERREDIVGGAEESGGALVD